MGAGAGQRQQPRRRQRHDRLRYLINKKGDSHVIAGATPMIVSGKLRGGCRATTATR